MTNPLDLLPLQPVAPPASAMMPFHVPMDVPEDDHWLWQQIRERSSKVSNLEEEITMLRYYRTKMQESLRIHSAAARMEFQSRLLDDLFKRLNYAVSKGEVPQSAQQPTMAWMSQAIQEAVTRHFPEWDLGPRELKAFQDNITATGKVAEQYKKIIDGMTININTEALEEKVTWIMVNIVMPAIPREYWPNIENALLQNSPEFGDVVQEEV